MSQDPRSARVHELPPEVAAAFALPGGVIASRPYGNGHINDTFLAECEGGECFIFQRINQYVFRRPVQVMENIVRVTQHLSASVERPGQDCLMLTPTRAGDQWLAYEDDVWRAYVFVRDAVVYDTPPGPEQLREAAHAFARFTVDLADLPGPRVHETIPGFHDTPGRVEQLRAAVQGNPVGRLDAVRAEVGELLDRAERAGRLTDALERGELPERVVHNDTKINNVLFDRRGRAQCVIDLDTVMPGLAAADFGDAVRTGASTAAEDETDLDLVGLDMERFRALAEGYLHGAGDALNDDEAQSLVDGAWALTYEGCLRFLADHLIGDAYFRVHRPGHNLDRARSQLQLLREIERREPDMRNAVRELR